MTLGYKIFTNGNKHDYNIPLSRFQHFKKSGQNLTTDCQVKKYILDFINKTVIPQQQEIRHISLNKEVEEFKYHQNKYLLLLNLQFIVGQIPDLGLVRVQKPCVCVSPVSTPQPSSEVRLIVFLNTKVVGRIFTLTRKQQTSHLGKKVLIISQ